MHHELCFPIIFAICKLGTFFDSLQCNGRSEFCILLKKYSLFVWTMISVLSPLKNSAAKNFRSQGFPLSRLSALKTLCSQDFPLSRLPALSNFRTPESPLHLSKSPGIWPTCVTCFLSYMTLRIDKAWGEGLSVEPHILNLTFGLSR